MPPHAGHYYFLLPPHAGHCTPWHTNAPLPTTSLRFSSLLSSLSITSLLSFDDRCWSTSEFAISWTPCNKQTNVPSHLLHCAGEEGRIENDRDNPECAMGLGCSVRAGPSLHECPLGAIKNGGCEECTAAAVAEAPACVHAGCASLEGMRVVVVSGWACL